MFDHTVMSGDIPIRVRDYGGSGRPVLLLHGAGGNLAAWERFVPLLTESHRVLAMDLRGHGESGDAPWDFRAALDDVERVVVRLALEDPAVVGHSLGGMLAGMWGARHPECPGVVSLDGHRPPTTHLRNFADASPDAVRRDRDKLAALFEAGAQAMSRPMSPSEVSALLQQQRALAAARGIDEEFWESVTRRGMMMKGGKYYIRPHVTVMDRLRNTPEFLDAVPQFHAVECPFLILLATRNMAEVPEEFAALQQAFRAGLRRDLGKLDAARPNVRVTEVNASHGMLFEQPDYVAGLVLDFLNPR